MTPTPTVTMLGTLQEKWAPTRGEEFIEDMAALIQIVVQAAMLPADDGVVEDLEDKEE